MAVALGFNFTLAVDADGNIHVFGSNSQGQLGLGEPHMQHELPQLLDKDIVFDHQEVVMVAAGLKHACCVTKNGSLWTWGHNVWGQLGLGDDSANFILSPHLVCIPHTPKFARSPALMVACGEDHTVVLTVAGQVWTCGANFNGQCGYGNNDLFEFNQLTLVNPEIFGTSAPIGMIAAGDEHTMAVGRNDKTLWTWGSNIDGQLCLGNTVLRVYVPTQIPAATFGGAAVTTMDGGTDFTMIVTADGVLWACGHGSLGELGLGKRENFHTVQRVGGEDVFDGQGVRMAVCGMAHTIVVTNDNTMWTCGRDVLSILIHPQRNVLSFTRIDTPRNAVVIAAGLFHSAAVTEDGTLYTWSAGRHLQDPHGLGRDLWMVDHVETPVALATESLNGARIGQWHNFRPEHTLAFTMCTHNRLGEHTVASDFPDEVMRTMFENMFFVPPTGISEGHRSILGLHQF